MRYLVIFIALAIMSLAQGYANKEARINLWPLSKIIVRSALYQSLGFLVAFLVAIQLTPAQPNPEPVEQPMWVFMLLGFGYLFVVGNSIYETYTQVECERIERGNT